MDESQILCGLLAACCFLRSSTNTSHSPDPHSDGQRASRKGASEAWHSKSQKSKEAPPTFKNSLTGSPGRSRLAELPHEPLCHLALASGPDGSTSAFNMTQQAEQRWLASALIQFPHQIGSTRHSHNMTTAQLQGFNNVKVLLSFFADLDRAYCSSPCDAQGGHGGQRPFRYEPPLAGGSKIRCNMYI